MNTECYYWCVNYFLNKLFSEFVFHFWTKEILEYDKSQQNKNNKNLLQNIEHTATKNNHYGTIITKIIEIDFLRLICMLQLSFLRKFYSMKYPVCFHFSTWCYSFPKLIFNVNANDRSQFYWGLDTLMAIIAATATNSTIWMKRLR